MLWWRLAHHFGSRAAQFVRRVTKGGVSTPPVWRFKRRAASLANKQIAVAWDAARTSGMSLISWQHFVTHCSTKVRGRATPVLPLDFLVLPQCCPSTGRDPLSAMPSPARVGTGCTRARTCIRARSATGFAGDRCEPLTSCAGSARLKEPGPPVTLAGAPLKCKHRRQGCAGLAFSREAYC